MGRWLLGGGRSPGSRCTTRIQERLCFVSCEPLVLSIFFSSCVCEDRPSKDGVPLTLLLGPSTAEGGPLKHACQDPASHLPPPPFPIVSHDGSARKKSSFQELKCEASQSS